MAEPVTLARPYAKAAFAKARGENRLAEWDEALKLASAVADLPAVREHVLGNPLVAARDAAEFFLDVGKSVFDESIADFIRLLAENRRLSLLPEVAKLYARYRADAEQTLAVRVASSVALSDRQKSDLSKALQKRFDREVALDVHVDASLLGGAVIYAGDTVIDGSLKSKLNRLSAVLAR